MVLIQSRFTAVDIEAEITKAVSTGQDIESIPIYRWVLSNKSESLPELRRLFLEHESDEVRFATFQLLQEMQGVEGRRTYVAYCQRRADDVDLTIVSVLRYLEDTKSPVPASVLIAVLRSPDRISRFESQRRTWKRAASIAWSILQRQSPKESDDMREQSQDILQELDASIG
jgi:hypothetical protein